MTMTARETEKKAWADFSKWCQQWKIDHPDDKRNIYELALIYPDGIED